MKKTIHCVSGLPRAGSTLLCSILAQNPRFQVTPTSGIIEIMLGVRNHWNKILEFQAAPNEPAKLRVMRAALEAFFDEPNNDRPVVFDKCRGWLAALESLEAILESKARVVVPVRDVRDVLASFEQLWRIDSSTWELPQEHANYFRWQTIEGRCEVWMSPNQPVGLAYNRIQDALARGFGDRMHFVEFDELTRNPRAVMQGVYEFLKEPWFEHDFEHIQPATTEDDSRLGIPGLHEIRPKLEPVLPLWPKYLGIAADKYVRLNSLWRTARQTPAPSRPVVTAPAAEERKEPSEPVPVASPV
jgi:sulfotransferase